VLLKAIDHELPLRIEAHRSEDILNALELSEEFNLDIILEGATDAYLVADKLAEADVPVVLGPVVRTHLFENNEYRRHTARNAGALTRAGVSWTIGSGADDPIEARFVAMNAQLAFAHGAAGDGWLAAVTKNAARILSLSKRIGRLARGMQADLVIWTGDPSDPASTVDRVYVAGKLVYVAPRAQAQGGGS
jgi:imidazolonepropionase-like amidohydrolase